MVIGRHSNILPLFNPYTLAALTVLAMVLAYLGVTILDDHSGFSQLYLLMVIQITPFIIALTRRYYNYLAFVFFNHFITYSVYKYNDIVTLQHLTQLPEISINAIRELTWCSAIMMLSYFASRSLFFHDFVHKQKYQALIVSPVQITFLACYVIFVQVFLHYIPSQFLVLHFALMSADMLLLMCVEVPGYERFAKFMRSLVAVSCMWYFLDTGFLSVVGQYAAFRFITICLRKRYKEFFSLALLTVLVSSVQTVKGDYRNFINWLTLPLSPRLAINWSDWAIFWFGNTSPMSWKVKMKIPKQRHKIPCSRDSLESAMIPSNEFWPGLHRVFPTGTGIPTPVFHSCLFRVRFGLISRAVIFGTTSEGLMDI